MGKNDICESTGISYARVDKYLRIGIGSMHISLTHKNAIVFPLQVHAKWALVVAHLQVFKVLVLLQLQLNFSCYRRNRLH